MIDEGKQETPTTDASDAEAQPRRVRFDYIKSTAFRVIHADGAVGGLTPRLDIHMDFWSERFPIPKQVVHVLRSDGTLGDEVMTERSAREAIVREVEVGVVLDVENAKALRDWLSDRIAEQERILEERNRKSTEKP